MKKHPKKKYKSGELAKTRSNLGKISEDEAKKMTKVLGGEIGIEEDAEDIEKKYKKLAALERRKKRLADIAMAREEIAKRRREREQKEEQAEESSQARNDRAEKKLGYMDRIRIDYLASKPEYRIKNITGVIATLFSFLMDVPDYINPLFIKNANELFFFALSSFVSSIRGLYTKTKREIYKEISKNAFYANILATIKTWDIEGISSELSMLQRNPYRSQVLQSRGLVRKVWRPFGILLYLDHDSQIRRAIRWAYEMNIALTPPDERRAWKNFTGLFETAIELLPAVFSDTKRMFYPLLLKHGSNRFFFFEEFIVRERKSIFRFLGLEPENILNPGEEKISRPRQTKQRGESEVSDRETGDEEPGEHNEEISGKEFEGTDIASKADFAAGIKLLEELFPGAGFKNLDTYPDLYPYFKPLFEFSQGFVLVPPSDPLQQVVVITTIIDNIFYSFRHIRFGVLRNSRLEPRQIKEEVELLIAEWPKSLEEIVFKTYIARLEDFCRNIEKDSSFIKSELGAKAAGELEAIKKIHFLPYLESGSIVYGTILPKKKQPKFYEIVSATRKLLLELRKEIEHPNRHKPRSAQKAESKADSGSESVLNPQEQYVFDVENPVSRRLDWILAKRKNKHGTADSIEKRTNESILKISLILVSALDWLVNSMQSHFYTNATEGLYRTTAGSSQVPEYSVELADTIGILKKSEQEIEKGPAESNEERNVGTYVRDYELSVSLAHEIEEYSIDPNPFTFVFISLNGNARLGMDADVRAEEKVKAEIRPASDIFFRLGEKEILILLKKTDIVRARTIGSGIITSLLSLPEFKNAELSPSCGIIQYRKDWNLESLLKVIERMETVVKKQTTPRVIFLDNETLTLKGFPITDPKAK